MLKNEAQSFSTCVYTKGVYSAINFSFKSDYKNKSPFVCKDRFFILFIKLDNIFIQETRYQSDLMFPLRIETIYVHISLKCTNA